MLHCGLEGRILQLVCRRHGLNVEVEQFRQEQIFSYRMKADRKGPDLVLLRGHFISLFNELDKDRTIPYVVVSSKEKYGEGQAVFVHAEKGYGADQTLPIYHAIARAFKRIIEGPGNGGAPGAWEHEKPAAQ
jgi:hypothetical protein